MIKSEETTDMDISHDTVNEREELEFEMAKPIDKDDANMSTQVDNDKMQTPWPVKKDDFKIPGLPVEHRRKSDHHKSSLILKQNDIIISTSSTENNPHSHESNTAPVAKSQTNVIEGNSIVVLNSTQNYSTGKPDNKVIGNVKPVVRSSATPKSIPYKEPHWGGVAPRQGYALEILKDGRIVEEVDLSCRSFTLIGRGSSCDLVVEHPSISRFHVVVQYRNVRETEGDLQQGLYLYDLGSTHGTFLNKELLVPRCFHRVRVGHQIKLGQSSRSYIMKGPAEDMEAESGLTVTEIKSQRLAMEEADQRRRVERKVDVKNEAGNDDNVCMWGIPEDAIDDDDERNADNPFAVIEDKKPMNLTDPKKTLRGYFEREGEELVYDCEESGVGKFTCRVELPVEDADGRAVVAEAVVSGKKKEAVVQCALEACRMLDARGLLRRAFHERRETKRKQLADADYYDSDEDVYLDRTGDVEKKRRRRMVQAGVLHEEVHTHRSLTERLTAVDNEVREIEGLLETPIEVDDKTSKDESLDDYMKGIKRCAMDARRRYDARRRLFALRKERGDLQRLVKVTKPTALPTIVSSSGGVNVLVGKRGGLAGVVKRTRRCCVTPRSTSADKVETGDTEEDDINEKLSELGPVVKNEGTLDRIQSETESTQHKIIIDSKSNSYHLSPDSDAVIVNDIPVTITGDDEIQDPPVDNQKFKHETPVKKISLKIKGPTMPPGWKPPVSDYMLGYS